MLLGTDLSDTSFELKPGALPPVRILQFANNLHKMKLKRSPHSLVELRETFKDAGLRKQEREVTYAIKHTERLNAWNDGLGGKIESIFGLVFFEATCNYGMSPLRPAVILLLFIPILTIVYVIPIAFIKKGRPGIWAVWAIDRIHQNEGGKLPVRLNSSFFFQKIQLMSMDMWWRPVFSAISALLIGLYFSILSAFHIGWRDFNVGSWITRMQPREYNLRATGWVRIISGAQSLLSVYLLSLWILTYFGRLFE